MPIKGLEAAKRRTTQIVGKITANSEKAVREVLIIGRGYADAMTPVAVSTLINSQYVDVQVMPDGIKGRIGYTAAYAAAVHAAKGVLLGTNTPRSPASLGVVWGPDAKPQWLSRAFEEDGAAEIDAVIIRNMRL